MVTRIDPSLVEPSLVEPSLVEPSLVTRIDRTIVPESERMHLDVLVVEHMDCNLVTGAVATMAELVDCSSIPFVEVA